MKLAWEKDFKATGAMRGIGWVVLYQDITNGKLLNFWINEHDISHPAGCNPLLIMDVFEDAFMFDYGLKRADYMAVFFKNIDWETVEKDWDRKTERPLYNHKTVTCLRLKQRREIPSIWSSF